MNKFLFLFIILINSCFGQNPLYTPSDSLPKYNQNSFDEYIKDNMSWLKNNRIFLSKNHDLELNLNIPSESKASKQKVSKGILLVHGLGDSPGYFHDLTKELVKQGFLVRTVLLTGHGSKPADLINVKFKQWEDLVSHHIKLLEKEIDELWLGGFSTGANLITSYAIQNEKDISGLLLFSPGFASNQADLLPWSGIGSYFKTWLFQNGESGNILRYESLSMNASYLYYQSLKSVQDNLKEKSFTKPVFVTISEDDSVINSKEIVSIFSKSFQNPNSRLLWFGEKSTSKDKRVISLLSFLPKYNIANFSHLSVLFKKEHFFYGEDGSFTMFKNGQDKIFNEQKDELWYSAWGLQKKGKYFARLTWNPYFKETMIFMNDVINSK